MTTVNLPLDDNDTLDQYVSVGESQFVTSFPVLEASELKVSIDAVPKVYGSDWSVVSGLGGPGGLTIQFSAATTPGQLVSLWLDKPIERETGFAAGAATLYPEDLNAEFVNVLRIAQQLRREIRQAVRLAPDDPVASVDMRLPPVAQRAEKWLRFNSAGVLELAELLASGTTLSASVIGELVTPLSAREQAAGLTDADLARPWVPVGNVLRYGGSGNGLADDTAAIAKARLVTAGRYHLPSGTWVHDASPDIWLDAFTADGETYLVIDGDPAVDVSNAFAGRLRYVIGSNELTWIEDARTGDRIQGWQNNQSGRATYFLRGLSITSDSHALQMIPTTETDSIDVLMQRAADHSTDPAGNRFSFTFDQANDRWLFSYATSASGAPAFDTWMEAGAGTSAYLTFPGIQPLFNQGWSIKRRSSGGVHLEIVPNDTSFSTLRDKDTPTNILMTWGSGTLGFFGASPSGRQTVTGSRGGNAALADLLSKLATLGLITDSTS